ncbi:MAG: penicillin-binding transpeptidase domain-containing protein [Candidatus Cryptobacteroides sp.]|nr:penicillin-binding transpeptidase domain-containing protein [Candidatus Cryptobacteroides sp.]MEE3465843.1 penicillin-binding transpeptidase domain-containing protein [Candidatus Cryptobacteroides sp.]
MNENGRHIRLLIGLGAAVLLLLGSIFSIQLLDDRYKQDADRNSTVYETIYPTRGAIFDRNGAVLVGNKVAYDILVSPREVKAFDTLALATALGVTPEFIRGKMDEYHRKRASIGFQAVTMMRMVPAETYLRFEEVKYKFPGFRGQSRGMREYPVNAGGNLLGYVSEVNQRYMDRHPGEYRSGDYAGMTGIEAAREQDLRGEKGYHIYLRNARNQIEQPFKDGTMDKEAVPGKNITTTIDAQLQQYGQELMAGKVGSVVAIEPSTGEILALVSSPGIDVEQLADIGKHYNEIAKNPYKPMYNRAVQASYPPGSVFKLVNALIGMQEGVLRPEMRYPCSHGYHYGAGHKLGCHGHRSPIDMTESIMMSCNAYYCYVLKNIVDNRKYDSPADGLDHWSEYVKSFGFGRKLGSDFPAELAGSIPSSRTYNRSYGRGRWNSTTVISLSIGQGEILATPMHLANLCATIANRGHYYIPHIIKASEGIEIDPRFYEPQYTLVDTTHFPKVIRGMWLAVNAPAGAGGTARVAHVDSLDICGKTGTAQNPRGADNSVFICFAPQDNPKIALAAYVENGGFGAAYAAPIASLMAEKYLKGKTSRPELEKRMMESNLMDRVKHD